MGARQNTSSIPSSGVAGTITINPATEPLHIQAAPWPENAHVHMEQRPRMCTSPDCVLDTTETAADPTASSSAQGDQPTRLYGEELGIVGKTSVQDLAQMVLDRDAEVSHLQSVLAAATDFCESDHDLNTSVEVLTKLIAILTTAPPQADSEVASNTL